MIAPALDRQPPCALEAEVSVLGGMLIDAEAVSVAMEILTPDLFYREANRRIFRAMASLYEAGSVIDPVTVGEQLKATGELESVGGMVAIGDLVDPSAASAATIGHHARIVRDRATLRRAIEAASQVIRDCYEPGERTTDEIVDAAQRRLADVANDTAGGGLVWVKKDLYAAFEALDERRKNPGATGIPTGFRDLDHKTGGFRRKQYWIVAARPSMGKTALGVQFMLHCAIGRQTPAAMFSAEMSRAEIIDRMLCGEALVDLLAYQQGRCADEDYVRLAQAAGHLNSAPLYVDDAAAPTVMQLRARVRRAKIEHPDLALVIVDHIGFMAGEGENRQNEVAGISRGLKALAKDLDVCVVALSQLSREPTKRADSRPQLADLRDSGSLEQDADVVLMLHRPEYYVSTREAREKGMEGQAELLIRKQRNGPTGEIDLYFRKSCARFESATQDEPADRPDNRWMDEREVA